MQSDVELLAVDQGHQGHQDLTPTQARANAWSCG